MAIYDRLTAADTFEDVAARLVATLRDAAARWPGQPRHLFLDIEGHRSPDGGYDFDAFELQAHFIVGLLSRWLTSISVPLVKSTNNAAQRDDIPEELEILVGPSADNRAASIASAAQQLGMPIYDSQTGTWVG